MDLTIPGAMGGREAIKRLREVDPEVKAVVSSGYATDSIMTDFSEHGFCACVAKPYRIEELGEALHRAIPGGGQ
ncbi:MAG: response regulator, partial [Armatimonadota bacterium]|jgi:DNA-binding NarL/FixJ family response regulator